MQLRYQQPLRRLGLAFGAAFCLFFLMTALTAQPVFAAEINVETTTDEANLNDPNGLCSLREAIINANTNAAVFSDCPSGDATGDTIVLPAGVYNLTIAGGSYSYDFDITDGGPLTITGAGARTTIINGDTLPGSTQSRIFEIQSDAVVTIQDLTITGGYVSNNNDGGGIRVAEDATLTVQRVALVDNWSSRYGGAIHNEGTLFLIDSLLNRNDVNFGGGGLANFATATVTNTTISNNAVLNFGAAGGGGGITNLTSAAQLSLAYTTVYNNAFLGMTNGVNLHNNNGNVTVTASIVALDSLVGQAPSCSGVFSSGGYNIDSGNTCAFSATSDLSNTAPLLGALVNAGGPTDVHPLQANSPAVDNVPSGAASCGGAVVTDQRGELRPQDGDGDNIADCDSGAVELASVTGSGGFTPIDVSVLTTVINSGNGPLSNPAQPLGPNPVIAGESYRFFVEIENLDQVNAASGVIVHDTLIGLTAATVVEILPAAGWSCSFGGSQLLCSYTGDLLGNGSPTPVAEVEIVIDAAQPGGIISHYLQASTLNPDVDLSNNACDLNAATVDTADDCVTFTVETEATLSLEVGDLNEPLVAGGDAVIYPVVVSNSGPSAAANVAVSAAVPADLVLVSLSAGDVMTCTHNIATGTGSCTIPTIPAGDAVTFYAAVRAASSAVTGMVNALSVEVTTADNDTFNQPSIVEETRVDAVADLSVAQNGPLSVTVGGNAVYTVTVTNNGPSNAAGIIVTNTLPAQMTFVSAVGATCSAAGRVVTCSPFDLAAGASQPVIVTAAVDAAVCYAGSVTNSVVVGPDRYVTDANYPVLTLPLPDAANNQAQWTHEIASAANLSVTKSVVNSPVNAGDVVEFAIQVTNSGPGCAPNVFVLDELNSNDNPDGLEQVEYYAFQSTQGDNGGIFSGWYYVCTSGLCGRGTPMPAGTTDTIQLFARVPADTPAGNYINWVNVFSTDAPGPNDTPVEDAAAPWTVTTDADLSIAKTLLTPGTVVPGGLLQYEIVVTNDGPSVATGLNVTDTLTAGFPAGTQIVAASPECTGAPATQITCAVDNLWPGQRLDFLVTVQAGANAASGATIQNCAAVNDLPGGVNNACAAVATVASTNPSLPNTDLELISMSCSPVLPGSAATATACTVIVNNSGSATAANVTLAQRLVNIIPQATSLSFATTQQGVNPNTLWNCTGGLLCTRTTPMSAGAVDTLTFNFRTLPDAHLNAFGQSIQVEASVTSSNPDTSLFNNRLIVSPNVEPSADLRVDKVALTQNPAPGSTVLFAVTVYNDGFSDVDGIAIDELITTGNATILSVTPAGTVYIAAGASQQFLVTAKIDDTAIPGDTVTNQVTVNTANVIDGLSTLATATGYNGTINNVLSDTVSVTVGGALPDADISVTNGSVTNGIVHNTSPIVAGGLYSFTVSVSNLGPAQAQGVVVHDLLLNLPGAQIVDVVSAANWQCSGALTCTRSGAMPVATETVATVTVTIPASTPAGVYRHRLAASADSPDPVPANNSSEIFSFTVTTQTSLSLNVDDLNAVLTAGDAPTRYPIQVTNDGPSDAANVAVTVALPPGFVLSALQGELPTFCNLGAATCTLPTIPAGGSRTLYADVAADAATQPAVDTPVLKACIVGTEICDTENGDVVTRADLVLHKRATATVNAGDTITYTVDVLNLGPSDAQNVQVIDTLPAGVSVESAGVCTENAGVITCPATTLAAGTSQSYSFLVRTDAAAQPGTSLENVAVVSSSTADLNTLNNQDSADTSIVSLAALSLTKTAGADTVNAGESVTFDIVVTNNGPSTAANVTVEDALPLGLTLVEAGVDLGNGAQPCGGILCGVGDLAAGASATVRITALAAADLAAGTVLTNVAQVRSAAAEANLANNRAEAAVTVTTLAQITLTKEDLLDPVVVNDLAGVDDLAYVLTVANVGPSAAAAVQVTDTLPAGVVGRAFVFSSSWVPGAQPGGQLGTCVGAGELVCDLGAIPAGEQVQIYVTADVQDALLCGTEVTNQAAASWIDSRGTATAAPVTAGTGLLCQSGVSVQKSGPAAVSLGEAATYVITVTNSGRLALLPGQLTLSDLTPPGLTFVGIAAQSGTCAFSGTSPWTNSATLAAGESCSVTLEYTVSAAACPAGVLLNRAQVSTQFGDSDQDIVLTTVACDTVLDISLTPDFFPDELVAGNIVDFLITVANLGDVTAFDVELTGNVFFPEFGARIVDFFPQGAFSAGECTNNGFCNLGDLPAGEEITVVASVAIDSDQALFFANSLVKDACAEADNATRICLADVEQLFDEPILSDVELDIYKQVLFDPIVVSGGSVSADGFYILEVANDGLSDADSVVISDTLPAGMVVSDEPVLTTSFGYGFVFFDCTVDGDSVGSNQLLCLLDSPLPAGETVQIVVPVGFEPATAANFCVEPNNSFTNVAELLWFDDIDGEQSFLSNEVTSNFVCRGDVDVIKSGPAEVTYAEAAAGFRYAVTVQNTGPSPIVAGALTVTDTLPVGLFFDAASPVDGGMCILATSAQTGDGVVVFTNGAPLGAGESCTVTFGVTTAPNGQSPAESLFAAGDLFNVATVAYGNDRAQAVWQTQIDFSTQLTVTKAALTPVVAGQEAIFEIVITNTGDAPAFDLLLTDNVNARSPVDLLGARIVNMSVLGQPAGLCSDGGLCRIDQLAAQESITVLATVLVDADSMSNEVRQQACAAAANAETTCAAATAEIERVTDVRIRKDDLGNVLVAGGAPVQYIITVWNEDGPSTAHDVVVRDDMFPGFVLVGDLEPGSQRVDCPDIPGAGDNVCIIRALRPGDSVELYATVAAVADAVDAVETPVNQACIVEIDGVALDEPLCDTESTNVVTQADLALVKNAPATVGAGDLITYTIDLSNLGPSLAQNVAVADVLPAGLALVSVSASQGGCNSLPCVLGTMPVGSSAVVTIVTRVAGDALVGSSIENVATVSASTTDPNPTNDSDDADTSIVTVANLSITKQTDVITATAGLPVTYTIVVRNAGPGLARNVTVQDALPTGMTLLSATVTPPQGDPFLCAGTLCAVGDLDAGESATITLIARVDPAYSGATITNRATVTSLAFDPAPADNDSGPVTTPVTQAADLTIAKRSLPDVAVPGERLTYEITVRNVGPSDAAGVTVDDLLPAGFTPLTVRSSQAGCSSLPCTLGTIPAGASASVTVVGAVEASVVEALVNTAAVTAQTSLVNTADDSVTLSTPISALADLYIQKFGTSTVNAGEAIAYTIRVINQGPSDAQNVQVIDSLPPGVNVTGDGGCTLADGTLTCVLGTVAAGQMAQIDLSATAAITLWPGTRLENRATVTSSTPDRTQADNVAVAATNIVGATDLSLSQSGPETVVAGTEIAYTIVVTNNGPSLARGVDVRNSLPSGLTLIEATIQRSGRGLQLCSGAVCQLGEMSLGESAVVTMRALVGPNLPAGTVLTNTATIFTVTDEVNPANNSASVDTVVITSADIEVSVLDLSDPVQPTGGFVYDISLTNNGPSMARGVVITSVLDSNVTFASISPLCPFNDGLLVCDVGNLAVGGRVRFLLAVVAADVPNSTLLVNTVTATTTTPDPQPENNTAAEITTVQLGFGPSADLGVTKSASQPVVDAGSLVTYTMVISNAGPAEAADVKLIEVIPPGTRLVGIRVNNPAFASATCALSGLCLLGKVPLGVNVTVTATLLVERNFADILVNNLVTVISDQIDPQPRNNIAVSVVDVIPFVALPSVRIEKALSPTGAAVNGVVPVGERITFTIDIANIGELQIVDMPLFDTYDPTKLVFVSASPPPSNSSLGVIRWENLLPGVVSLAPGDSLRVITVFETVGSSATSIDGVTENIALVNAAEGQNGETAPAVSSAATVKITSPSVAIRKSVDASTPTVVLPGDLITFSITVSNTGDTRLTTIPVVDRFDDNHLAFVSAEIAPTAILAEEVRWADVGDLEAEETLSFTVTFRLIADVPFVDNVAALGVVLDANGDSAFDTSTGQMLAEVGVARLGFELDALPAPNTEIRPGDVITYYLRLHNRGGIPLSNATLVIGVPDGTTLLRFDEVPSPLGSMSAPLSAVPETAVPATGDNTVYEWKFTRLAVNQSFETLMIVQVDRESTRQVISMVATYGSDEIPTGQSNELTHPLSPTAITLDSFSVEQRADGVLVRWQTAAEVNSWGFYVLRSVYGEGVPVRVNTTLIPATGAGSVYEYVDTGALAGINEGIVYEYWLQEVELDGDLIEYGPNLIGQGTERIFLPTVER